MSLRHYLERIARDIVSRAKSSLGIRSPSRTYADLRLDKLSIDGKPRPPSPPLPWYAARDARDPYESPELRRAARRVRRLVRRHALALRYDPDGPIALSVRAAMKGPIESVPAASMLDVLAQVKRYFDAGKLQIDPKAVDDFAEQCGVKWSDKP